MPAKPQPKPINVEVVDPADVRLQVLKDQKANKDLVSLFHQMFYYTPYTWRSAKWMGVQVFKFPTDLFVYQEILWTTEPDLIIETGTAYGGTSLFLCHMLDLMKAPKDAKVVTVELSPDYIAPSHSRLVALKGNSVSPKVVAKVRKYAEQAQRVMVVLDSNHRAAHVSAEIKAYAPMVTVGCYLIVEDTNLNLYVKPGKGKQKLDGPAEAVNVFLKANHKQFLKDPLWERFLLTANPGGYLLRVAW